MIPAPAARACVIAARTTAWRHIRKVWRLLGTGGWEWEELPPSALHLLDLEIHIAQPPELIHLGCSWRGHWTWTCSTFVMSTSRAEACSAEVFVRPLATALEHGSSHGCFTCSY